MNTCSREFVASIMKQVFDECSSLRDAGQKEYAHDELNAYANFERIAQRMNLSREQVLMVYAEKHIDGIHSYIKGHKSQRESVKGRINDVIVYLTILRGMVEDNERPTMDHGNKEETTATSARSTVDLLEGFPGAMPHPEPGTLTKSEVEAIYRTEVLQEHVTAGCPICTHDHARSCDDQDQSCLFVTEFDEHTPKYCGCTGELELPVGLIDDTTQPLLPLCSNCSNRTAKNGVCTICSTRIQRWVCEFCYLQAEGNQFPKPWRWHYQTAICPDCWTKLASAGGIANVKGGAYAPPSRTDPRLAS